jgi:hypothetical protein
MEMKEILGIAALVVLLLSTGCATRTEEQPGIYSFEHIKTL